MAALTFESQPRTLPAGMGAPLGSWAAPNPLGAVGYRLTLLFIFLLVARVPEITTFLIHSSLYQILILTTILLALSMITGELVRVGSTRPGVFWIAFHLWVVLTVPFSGYRRGSLEMLQPVLMLFLPMFFLGGFLTQKADGLRKGVWAMAWAGVVALVWIQYTGVYDDTDRFESMGTFGNSNLMAIYLLVLIPFWSFIVVNRRYFWVTRLAFSLVIGLALVSVLRTGSRSALMTIGLMAFPVFFSLKLADKLKFVLVAAVAVAAVLAAAPDSLKKRWATVVGSDRTNQIADSALGSSDARFALLMESIEMTIKHPIVGVGVGVYVDVVGSQKQRDGERALWQVTHNMYTEVSAENGIPGFILYMTGLWLTLKGLWNVRRQAKPDPEMRDFYMVSVTLLFCWISYCFNGFFTSMANDFVMYVLVGFSIATMLAYQQAFARKQFAASPSAESNQAPIRNSLFFGKGPLLASQRPAAPANAKDPVQPTNPAGANGDAPWRRNPRKYPPQLGTPAR